MTLATLSKVLSRGLNFNFNNLSFCGGSTVYNRVCSTGTDRGNFMNFELRRVSMSEFLAEK